MRDKHLKPSMFLAENKLHLICLENKDNVQNKLDLRNRIFNQGGSTAKKCGGSNALIFSKFGQKLKKKTKNFNLLFPKTEGSKCFPSSYGCYGTVSATQEKGKRSSKDKHFVHCSIN